MKNPSPVTGDWRINALVFCAGAVLMGLEIAGSRILAPHFGNSVYVWGSLISVVLLALAGGYALGGALADRASSRRLLCTVCILAAGWIFGLASFGHAVCAGLEGIGERPGSLLSAVALLLPPGLALGMVAPMSLHLSTTSLDRVGRTSGALYAVSTIGSVVGTLGVAFVMIPSMGVSLILRVLAGILIFAACLALPLHKDPSSRIALVAALFIVAIGALLPIAPSTPLIPGDVLVLENESVYHSIAVVDNGDSRQLRFDKYIETAIQLSPPQKSLIPYTNYFNLAFLAKPRMRHVLFIGAGGGVGPRAFMAHDPQIQIDVVDIDPAVLTIAREQFFLKPSASLRLIAEDGRAFLRKSQQTYDCVILDAFTIGGRIPFHLVTREAFELCSSRLAPDGVLLMNLGSALEGPGSGIYASLRRTSAAVFPHVDAFAVDHREMNPRDTMNIVLFCSKAGGAMTADDWLARLDRYSSDAHVSGGMLRQAIADRLDPPAESGAGQIFSDDFAPIETMEY